MSGTLEITLCEAHDLIDVDFLGKQDPYCVLSVGTLSVRSNTHTDGGTDPVWNQCFTFINVHSKEILTVELFDENVITRNVSIGTCKVALNEVFAQGAQDLKLPVITTRGKVHKGHLHLRLVYRQAALSPTALGVVIPENQGPAIRRYTSFQSPRPTSGYRPGQWILPNYKDTDCWQDYVQGQVLGKGSYGTTYLCQHRKTGQKVACKVISKRRLTIPAEVEDVQREVQIMHHLEGNPNIVKLINVYEDNHNICLVMELCMGGEIFEQIVARGSLTEREAANYLRTIVSVVAHCHHMGVIHRDIKPQNFLLSDRSPNARVMTTDFGLSMFFEEGELLTEVLGSAYYMAPEVLRRAYGKEADIWSCGVVLYMLLSGHPPFRGKTESEIFSAVATQPLDLDSDPWPKISGPAKDCLLRMLEKDPRKRATATEILKHDWMRENGVATNNPIELEVLTRIKYFCGLNKLKKEALKVIAGTLPVDEIAGLREMFLEIDKNRSGTITVDEFAKAVRSKGQQISMPEVASLLEESDVNGDGILDYEEFLAVMINAGKMEREERLKTAFEHFDKDGNGLISKAELQQALHDIRLTDDQVLATLEEVDLDNSGTIDYNEFCSMMRKTHV